MDSPAFKHLPKHLRDKCNAELERDRKTGNTFWTTPMTKEKLRPVTSKEWEQALELAFKDLTGNEQEIRPWRDDGTDKAMRKRWNRERKKFLERNKTNDGK